MSLNHGEHGDHFVASTFLDSACCSRLNKRQNYENESISSIRLSDLHVRRGLNASCMAETAVPHSGGRSRAGSPCHGEGGRGARLGRGLLVRCGIVGMADGCDGGDGDSAAFEGGFFADGVCRIAGGFVARCIFGPEVVPVDGHEDCADLCICVDAEDGPGAAATAFDLDALAVVQSQRICVFGVHL